MHDILSGLGRFLAYDNDTQLSPNRFDPGHYLNVGLVSTKEAKSVT
jgi:hypothetical protein